MIRTSNILFRLCLILLVAFIVLANPPRAHANTTPVILGALAYIIGGSFVVNEGIMLVCQKRPLTWQEAPHALMPVISQIQALKACKRGVRK